MTQPEGDVWLTKDGRMIPIQEMTDAHLIHSVAWAKRNRLSARLQMAEREVARRFCTAHEDCKSLLALAKACKASLLPGEEQSK